MVAVIPLQEFKNVGKGYYLLPFRFTRLPNEKEVLVNEAGDFIFCDNGTSRKIATHSIDIDSSIYEDLVSSFFISESPIPDLVDVLAARVRTKKSFLDAFTRLHIFVMTLRCNSSCTYCQVGSYNATCPDYDISYDALDRSIDLMFMSPSKCLTVEYQGGEPLLVFDKIKYAVERISRRNDKENRSITYVICTNLLLLTDEILDFCKAHRILISTSLDGPKHIHSLNRPSSSKDDFDLLRSNINRCREALGRNSISALATVPESSLDYPIELVNEYIDQGFNSIFLRALNPYGRASKYRKIDSDYTRRFVLFYKDALTYILQLNMQGIHFAEEYASVIMTKALTPFPSGYTDLQSPAGIVNSVAVYNYDGYVYASDESRMLACEGDLSFRLGHVSQDSYADIFCGARARAGAEYACNEALPGCSECAFQAYCGADPVRNHTTQGDPVGYRPTNSFCQKNKAIIGLLFQLMSESIRNQSIFRSWVNRS